MVYRDVLLAQYCSSQQGMDAATQCTSGFDPFEHVQHHRDGPTSQSSLENMTCIFDVTDKIHYNLKKKVEKTGEFLNSEHSVHVRDHTPS